MKIQTSIFYPDSGWPIILYFEKSVLTDYGEILIYVKQKMFNSAKFLFPSNIMDTCRKENIQCVDNQFIKDATKQNVKEVANQLATTLKDVCAGLLQTNIKIFH